jgi:hypothetical protein
MSVVNATAPSTKNTDKDAYYDRWKTDTSFFLKAQEEAKGLKSHSSAATMSVADAMSNVQLARPLRTDYEVKPTRFVSDMKKGWKKAVEKGKELYKEGKDMYREYKKSKEAERSQTN